MDSCDIIIPVWNQPHFTHDCVDSIRRCAGYPYRLILVDNASADETKKYLESIRDAQTILIRNEKNMGFVKAVNQGIAASEAPYVCVMNNDTIATDGWLEEMIAVAEMSKEIGIVNPSSNNLGQKPSNGEPIELYAARLKREKGKFSELGSCIGFCMLIKRRVIERIGNFDEIYGMGNFEDTDFSRRAAKEGYKSVRAHGAYVYHRENSSFNLIKTFDEDFERNKEIYEFRWGKPKRVAYILESSDKNVLKRLENDSLKLARDGGWVWYFLKEHLETPNHSNIKVIEIPQKFFYLSTVFKVLTKKKKFDEIFVGNESLYRILDSLSFIHKAKLNYY